MLRILFISLSYAALLLLLMPLSKTSVLWTAVMLALGLALIIYGKERIPAFKKGKNSFFAPFAIFLLAYCGPSFYGRWLPTTTMRSIAAAFHMPVAALLLAASTVLSVLSLCCVYTALQSLTRKLSETDPQGAFKRDLICCVFAAVITVIVAQVVVAAEVIPMGFLHFLGNTLLVLVPILLLYTLFGRTLPSVLIGSGLFMGISTVNAYVYSFRGRLLDPVDLYSFGTAMNVAENYSLFPIPFNLVVGWTIFLAMLADLFRLRHKNKALPTAGRRFLLLGACVICSAALLLYASGLKTYHWDKEGAYFNGSFLDFVSKFKEISAPKPEGYSPERIDELADRYAADSDKQQSETAAHPHIIVIMDEAFSDLQVLGDFSTNMAVMPFVSSLRENTICGYTLTSVFGGNTANSEYEFLTGNSFAWLSPNAVPYQQYLRSSTYSMVSYLKTSCQYKCLAMHPFASEGWNRPSAYSHLGFDTCYFVEDFPQKNYVRNYVSDREMFEFLIEQYEEQKEDPLFIFGVTMQNHGAYTHTGDDYTKYISLADHGGEFPEVEQYLSLIHETDRAVEYLISYFQAADEKVIIVFFGDHQPRLSESFYEMIGDPAEDTLDARQKRYEVPFFIWANYDIEEAYLDRSSLNYLSSHVYQAAGIALPPYNLFLQELEEKIPAINANGFYSLEDGGYLPVDDAKGEERLWLNLYEMLQYNSIFDQAHRNEKLFPVIKER